jgi:murein peptide amidase A
MPVAMLQHTIAAVHAPGRRRLAALLAPVAFAGCVAIAAADDDDPALHGRSGARHAVAHPSASIQRVVLGRSVQGRPIRALVLGDPNATKTALVVGNVHGDETGGFAVVRRLRGWRPPAGSGLWLVRSFNPDGTAAHTRQNAHGVDLNRNFPFHWRPLGPPGSREYAGPHPLSEPESRIEHSLILRIRPRLSIWFHQPLGVTDRSGGDARLEKRFAGLSRLPLRRLPRYPGSITSWQDFRVRHDTAFVVELPPGSPAPAAVTRYANAVEQLVTQALATP